MIHAFTAAESLYITQPDDVEMPDQGRLHKGEKEGEKKQKPGDVRSEESSVRRSSGPDPVRAVGIVFFFCNCLSGYHVLNTAQQAQLRRAWKLNCILIESAGKSKCQLTGPAFFFFFPAAGDIDVDLYW